MKKSPKRPNPAPWPTFFEKLAVVSCMAAFVALIPLWLILLPWLIAGAIIAAVLWLLVR